MINDDFEAYHEDYYPEDDIMPFTGWATIDIPWSNNVRLHARIRVGADLNPDGELVGDAWVDDVDWIELHDIDGFRKGRVRGYDPEDHAEKVIKLFEAMPMIAQQEALAGTTLADIDDREIVVG